MNAYILGAGRNGYPIGIVAGHIFRVVVTLLLLCASCSPTSVVVITDKRHHRIVVAADSLVRQRYGPAKPQCKIHVVTNECAFTMSGMYSQQTPPFDLFSLGQNACRETGDLQQRADDFLKAAFPQVINVVLYLSRTDPAYLKREFEGKPIIAVSFIGSYKGQPAVFIRGAILGNGRLEPQAINVPADSAWVFQGVSDHITDYINSHPKWEQYGDVSAARRLVRIESKAHPDLVGLPISIGAVDERGRFHWIDRGYCNNSQ